MSDLEKIERTLQHTAARKRWQNGWGGFWRGLFWGALILLVSLIAYKLAPLPQATVVWAAAAAVAAGLLGFLYGYSRAVNLEQTALWVDQNVQLKERLSTAINLRGKEVDPVWKNLVIRDAANVLEKVDPRNLVPFRVPTLSRWILTALAVAFSLGFVPEYRSPKYLAAKKEQQNIKETAQQLSDFTKRTLEKKPPVQPSAREALESAEKLGMDLAKNPTTRAEALKDLAKATDKIKQELKEMGKNPSLRSLERNMRQNSNQRSGSGNSAEMQKKMDSLQKAMEAKKTSPDAMEKLQQEMEKARDSAKAMAGNDSPEAAAARQQLAQTLASLSQQAQNMGIDPGKLDEAIAALQANQVDTFLKEMDQALNDLEKLQELAKNLEAMKNDAAGKLGKDLAEQLKFGQAEAAAETLRKMAEQLKSGRMSKEEMKKIADELSNAMDPAGQYGDVAKHLQEAMQKMAKDKAGEGSSESLAKAADELEKLLQQAADAESLMATLSALQKASQCIGNGMGWGQCQTPGSRPGGKPGRGVGTWANENGWENFADAYQDAGFDNSEIQRPDMDGRGVSDRGEGELNPNLQPTKVKGQMSPGGPMPSVSIKGLSIKGQSKVSYKEAVQAAQNEAESAIQDEKVPRAYRGAVRDYFDDLKQ